MHNVNKGFQELLYFFRAVPAHDMAGDLVAHQIGKHGGMPGAGAHGQPHGLLDIFLNLPLIKKAYMLRPGDADKHIDAVACGQIQKPARRDIVDTHRVDAGSRHHLKIVGHLRWLGQGLISHIGRKRAIGYAFDEKFLIRKKQKSSLHAWPFGDPAGRTNCNFFHLEHMLFKRLSRASPDFSIRGDDLILFLLTIYKRHAMKFCGSANTLKQLSFFIMFPNSSLSVPVGCWFSPASHQT